MTADYFDGFLARNRAALVTILDQQLAARATRTRSGSSSLLDAPPTAENLAVMRVAAVKRPNETDEAFERWVREHGPAYAGSRPGHPTRSRPGRPTRS